VAPEIVYVQAEVKTLVMEYLDYEIVTLRVQYGQPLIGYRVKGSPNVNVRTSKFQCMAEIRDLHQLEKL
jgi:hypothetical protein